MVSRPWITESSWPWRDRTHINVLKGRAYLRALRLRALEADDQRFVHGLDSNVVLGAVLKGRTSSRLLRPIVMKSAALQVGYGLYPGPHFCPTRLNISDCPTRSRPLPPPVPHHLAGFFPDRSLYGLSCLGGLSRPSANWLRLALLLSCLDSGSGFRQYARVRALPEAPPLEPRNQRDGARAKARAGTQLAQGRPVLERTSRNRAHLLALFCSWLAAGGVLLEDLLDSSKASPETVNAWVVCYGRMLFESGRPYWHYSELINGITARKPILKRCMQASWDLAFSWMALEPSTHHVAMPAVVLLGMLTTCLCWGWLAEAGLFALAWGGLLRDVLLSQNYILARIEEPKTRMRMARHQAAKVEQADLVLLIATAFGDLPPAEKLWPRCTQTLRRRFDLVLERMGVSSVARSGRQLDLGSFRPGGATHLLSMTENSELVRRRGRWASHRVMEIYIQEVMACTFLPSLPLETREQVLNLAHAFTATLEQVVEWKRLGVPTASWYGLFSAG
ncbi:unnamed protein product [Symbiodinium sp. CCMP2456]|nr:unnamed protein product [Symbiodinium sp. CCMP2456]